MNELLSASAPPSFTVKRLFFIVSRHKVMLAVCTMAGLVAAGVIFFTTPTVYRSEARLLLRYVADSTILDSAAAGERIVSPDRSGENIINSEMEVLTSRDLVEQVVTELGEDKFVGRNEPHPNRMYVVERALANLHVVVPTRSSVFRLYFDGATPTTAQDFLKRLVDLYLQKHIAVHRSVGAYDFLSQQTDQLRTKLAETEDELRKIKKEAGVVSVNEARSSLAGRMDELNKALDSAEEQLAASQAKMNVMSPLFAQEPKQVVAKPIVADTPAANELYDRLARLQDRELALLSTYREDSSILQDVRTQIEDIRALLKGQNKPLPIAGEPLLSTNLQSVLRGEEVNLASIQARVETLKRQIEDTKNEGRRLDEFEGRLVQLERNREIQESNYKFFSQSLEQARIDDALDAGKISNISIVQPASLPLFRLHPNLRRHMALAILLGVLCGLGMGILTDEFIDHTLKTALEVERELRIPVIVSAPLLAGQGAKAMAAGTAAGKPVDSPGSSLPVPAGKSFSELRVYFEALGNRLGSLTHETPRRPLVFGLTSCVQGSGVTTFACGLAIALARGGQERVLLIDLNTGGASAHRVFGVNPSGTLVDILADRDGNTAAVERNLYLLSSGQPGRNPDVGLVERVKQFVRHDGESEYDFVVLDMPPVSDTSLTLRMAGMTNAIVMVIEADKVDRDVARRAIELLARDKAAVVGAVFNKRRSFGPRWLPEPV